MSGVEEPKKDDDPAVLLKEQSTGIEDVSSSEEENLKKSAVSNRSGVTEEGYEDATWGDVCRTCFCHSPTEWVRILIVIALVCFFLFFFILGLEIIGDGAQVMTGCTAGGLFSDDMNPIAALMVGVLCTVCMQSSSTTTSIIVSLVGAGAIGVETAIYMVMGANIGTSVTNTIVAMGQLGDGDQLERAFAGATVHDMFNWLTVAVLLPLEVLTGYLYHLTEAISKDAKTGEENGETRESFVKRWIEPIGKLLISSNKDVIKHVSKGGSCSDFYPTTCEDPENPTKSTCDVGLISCVKKTDACPALFEAGATQSDDELGGLVAFLVGIVILFICLGGLVTVLQHALLGASQKIIRKATDLNGYVSMLIGAGLTIAVQSSSITTSTLTPLVGLDIITLEMMLPLTLGANIGTVITSLLAAMVTDGTDALQVALAHLFFNITGIIVWYPIPFMRAVPLHAARQLGKVTRVWKGFPIVYIVFLFFLAPLAMLGISSLFTLDTTGGTAAGSVLVVLICLGVIWFVWWWRCKNGKEAMGTYFGNRQKRADARETLSYDMAWAKRQIEEIQEHTGCPPLQTYPAPTVSNQEALKDIHTDMKYVDDMICKLLKHLGMAPDDCGCDAEGRFKRKESEIDSMREVDLSGWRNYHFAVLGTTLVIYALIFWGIGKLYVEGSVASTGMAGFLTICMALFLVYRAYCFFCDGGRDKSLANYKDMQLCKLYMGSYAQDIVEVKADIDNLVEHTNMPTLNDNGGGDEEDQSGSAEGPSKNDEEAP